MISIDSNCRSMDSVELRQDGDCSDDICDIHAKSQRKDSFSEIDKEGADGKKQKQESIGCRQSVGSSTTNFGRMCSIKSSQFVTRLANLDTRPLGARGSDVFTSTESMLAQYWPPAKIALAPVLKFSPDFFRADCL